MTMLTINGLTAALEYIQNNSRMLAYHKDGYKKDLIETPDAFNEDQAYHLRVIQALEPKLVTRLAPDYTVLSLDGQELLDILQDDLYIDSLVARLKAYGYTAPSDRQVFRLLQDRMDALPITDSQAISLPEVFTSFFEAATSANSKVKAEAQAPVVEQVVEQVQEAIPELEPVVINEQPIPKAAELIERTKGGKKNKVGA